MDGLGSSFSPTNTACMLIASNKSSNKTVMKKSVLDVLEGHYPCQSFTDALQILLVVGFELA
jgi:hypothetical protein